MYRYQENNLTAQPPEAYNNKEGESFRFDYYDKMKNGNMIDRIDYIVDPHSTE